MPRTIELGRAVLVSQSARLQLWFTTLITVSPQQLSTNIQHLKQSDLLDFLTSSKTWVRRGQAMHIELELITDGEPLERRGLVTLAEQIIDAPVWAQLNLCPSLPTDETSDNVAAEHGKLRINVQHARENTNTEAKSCHRMSSGVPSADIMVPEGIPEFGLSSIRFTMEILQLQHPNMSARSKRRKKLIRADASESATESIETPSLKTTSTFEFKDIDGDNEDEFFFDNGDSTWTTGGDNEARPQVGIRRRKKARRSTTSPTLTTSPPYDLHHKKSKRKRPSTLPTPSVSFAEIHPSRGLEGLGALVEAAMRLAVSNSPPKPASGVKATVNTFTRSLADIAPILWNPGYLNAFSQRAPFFPIISRSLSRASIANAQSLSLQDKITRATTCLASEDSISIHHERVEKLDEKTALKSLTAQLWTHAQGNLIFKSTSGPLRSFCAPNSQNDTRLDSDEDDLFDGSLVQNATNTRKLPLRDRSQVAVNRDEITASLTQHVSNYGNQSVVDGLTSNEARCVITAHSEDNMLFSPAESKSCARGAFRRDGLNMAPFGAEDELIDMQSSLVHPLEEEAGLQRENLHADMLLEEPPLHFSGGNEGRTHEKWTVEDSDQKSTTSEIMLLTI